MVAYWALAPMVSNFDYSDAELFSTMALCITTLSKVTHIMTVSLMIQARTTLSIALQFKSLAFNTMKLDADCFMLSGLCWVFLCWVFLCWVFLCWCLMQRGLCWLSLILNPESFIAMVSVTRSSVIMLSVVAP